MLSGAVPFTHIATEALNYSLSCCIGLAKCKECRPGSARFLKCILLVIRCQIQNLSWCSKNTIASFLLSRLLPWKPMLFCDPALQEILLEIRDKCLFKSHLMINQFSGKWQIIHASWILSFLTPPHLLLKSLSCQYPNISFENTVYLSLQHSLTLTSKCLITFGYLVSAFVILV